MPAVGDLVRPTEGAWMVLPPRRCPQGHSLACRVSVRAARRARRPCAAAAANIIVTTGLTPILTPILSCALATTHVHTRP